MIECHSIATAIAFTYQTEGRDPLTKPEIKFMTRSLDVDYIHPSPLNTKLVLRAEVKKINGKEAVIRCSLFADDKECVQAQIIAERV